jgi:DNA-binding LytR/AlgR family response regulator
MDHKVKILIVEDEMIIGSKISMQLISLGYEVTGIMTRGEDALMQLNSDTPDIVLLDINLKGSLDGIETATQIQLRQFIPIIYLTANADDKTFNRAKATKPFAFISKPFKLMDLQRAVELTISRMIENETDIIPMSASDTEKHFILSDRIFVRYKEKMVKIMLSDILYLEADRNYCHIFTLSKEYILTVTLKTMEEKLSAKIFQRIHRSYIINVSHVDEVAESSITIAHKTIPLGEGMREQLLKRMQTL